MRPQLRSSMPGMRARERRTPDMTLVSKKRVQSASGMSKKGFGSKMPALLTRMSMAPAALASLAQPSAVETSAAMPVTAPPPAALTAATPLSTVSCLRPLTTTLAPVAARPLAMARPMPAVEPVTSAVFPERSIFMQVLADCR